MYIYLLFCVYNARYIPKYVSAVKEGFNIICIYATIRQPGKNGKNSSHFKMYLIINIHYTYIVI